MASSSSQVNGFQERVPQIIREYSLNQWVDGKVEAREEKGHQVDNVAGAWGSGEDAEEQREQEEVEDAEQECHEVAKHTDDIAGVPLPTDHHVVLQDVDLSSGLNLGLGGNSVRWKWAQNILLLPTCFTSMVICTPSSTILLNIALAK